MSNREYNREWWRKKQEADPEFSKRKSLEWRTKYPKRYLTQVAKARARDKGFDFSITENSFDLPEFCPVFKIPLVMENTTAGRRNPNSPSLDRIDPNKGYVEGNVQVISWRANDLKRNGTLEEFEAIVNWMKNGQAKA